HVHDSLHERGLRGCLNFDCLGAGQWLTTLFQEDLQASREQVLFSLFPEVMQMHQTMWYLLELHNFTLSAEETHQINHLLSTVQAIASIKQLTAFDVQAFQSDANELIKKIIFRNISANDNHHQYMGHDFKGRSLSNYDLHMKVAIGADFRNCSLENTIFLGTDVRDADFTGCDLTKALFLTQAQVNSMKGNDQTILPTHLHRPETWNL
ncbi:MAG: pentapeptide repeat-containing protein, partial [Coprobacillus sp.]